MQIYKTNQKNNKCLLWEWCLHTQQENSTSQYLAGKILHSLLYVFDILGINSFLQALMHRKFFKTSLLQQEILKNSRTLDLKPDSFACRETLVTIKAGKTNRLHVKNIILKHFKLLNVTIENKNDRKST